MTTSNTQPADAALLREVGDRLDSHHSFICSLGTCRGCGETVTSAAFTLCGDCAAARLRALAVALDDMRVAAWDIEKLAGDVVACVDSISSNVRLHELTRTMAVVLHTIAPPPQPPEAP